jgi:hypothetical protein
VSNKLYSNGESQSSHRAENQIKEIEFQDITSFESP